MEARLNRTITDKFLSILMLVTVLIMFSMSYGKFDIYEKVIFILFIYASLTNAFFILATPSVKINGSSIELYSEVQPVILNFKPQIININEIIDIETSKKLLEYRLIFTLPHGSKIYHGFSATSDNKVKNLLAFLSENTNSEIIKMAYNKSFKPTPKSGAV